jgi:hypothetical protein
VLGAAASFPHPRAGCSTSNDYRKPSMDTWYAGGRVTAVKLIVVLAFLSW